MRHELGERYDAQGNVLTSTHGALTMTLRYDALSRRVYSDDALARVRVERDSVPCNSELVARAGF